MKATSLTVYTDGCIVRSHNRKIGVYKTDEFTYIEFYRVLKEPVEDFKESETQSIFKKAGISVLISKVKLSQDGFEDLLIALVSYRKRDTPF